jgi:phenylacetate-CoA ligase
MLSEEALYRHSPPWLQTVLLNLHAARIDRHRYGGRFRAELDRLMETDLWDRSSVSAFQNGLLQSVIHTAYEHTQYYRQVFDDVGVRPDDIRTVDDLRHVPILSKETVRGREADLISGQPKRSWLQGHTSGTTGSPLSIWYDRQTCVITNAVDARHKRWAGLRESDWIGKLLGRTVVPPDRSHGPFWRANHIHREVWFSSFHLSPETVPAYIARMRRSGLRFLEGYPSTLFIFAKLIRERGEYLPMQSVITSSETLHTAQRALIEEAFQCRLFDFYALAERVAYAGECEEHAGKHIAEEYSWVEVVDAKGDPVPDGEVGYLTGTSLWNHAMPMIRYRTSDLSSIETEACDCGRVHRRISSVTTKAEDVIVTPGGRLVSPSILTHPFKPLHGIARSQIVQNRLDHLLIRIVPAEHFSSDERERLIAALRERVGMEMAIDVETVLDIPPEPSGKFRWVISTVPNPTTLAWDSLGDEATPAP